MQVVPGDHGHVLGFFEDYAGLHEVVPGFERCFDADFVEDALAVGERAGVDFVADAIDFALPGPVVHGGAEHEVVHAIADTFGEIDEADFLAFEEGGHAALLDAHNIGNAYARGARGEHFVVDLGERGNDRVPCNVRILFREAVVIHGVLNPA